MGHRSHFMTNRYERYVAELGLKLVTHGNLTRYQLR